MGDFQFYIFDERFMDNLDQHPELIQGWFPKFENSRFSKNSKLSTNYSRFRSAIQQLHTRSEPYETLINTNQDNELNINNLFSEFNSDALIAEFQTPIDILYLLRKGNNDISLRGDICPFCGEQDFQNHKQIKDHIHHTHYNTIPPYDMPLYFYYLLPFLPELFYPIEFKKSDQTIERFNVHPFNLRSTTLEDIDNSIEDYCNQLKWKINPVLALFHYYYNNSKGKGIYPLPTPMRLQNYGMKHQIFKSRLWIKGIHFNDNTSAPNIIFTSPKTENVINDNYQINEVGIANPETTMYINQKAIRQIDQEITDETSDYKYGIILKRRGNLEDKLMTDMNNHGELELIKMIGIRKEEKIPDEWLIEQLKNPNNLIPEQMMIPSYQRFAKEIGEYLSWLKRCYGNEDEIKNNIIRGIEEIIKNYKNMGIPIRDANIKWENNEIDEIVFKDLQFLQLTNEIRRIEDVTTKRDEETREMIFECNQNIMERTFEFSQHFDDIDELLDFLCDGIHEYGNNINNLKEEIKETNGEIVEEINKIEENLDKKNEQIYELNKQQEDINIKLMNQQEEYRGMTEEIRKIIDDQQTKEMEVVKNLINKTDEMKEIWMKKEEIIEKIKVDGKENKEKLQNIKNEINTTMENIKIFKEEICKEEEEVKKRIELNKLQSMKENGEILMKLDETKLENEKGINQLMIKLKEFKKNSEETMINTNKALKELEIKSIENEKIRKEMNETIIEYKIKLNETIEKVDIAVKDINNESEQIKLLQDNLKKLKLKEEKDIGKIKKEIDKLKDETNEKIKLQKDEIKNNHEELEETIKKVEENNNNKNIEMVNKLNKTNLNLRKQKKTIKVHDAQLKEMKIDFGKQRNKQIKDVRNLKESIRINEINDKKEFKKQQKELDEHGQRMVEIENDIQDNSKEILKIKEDCKTNNDGLNNAIKQQERKLRNLNQKSIINTKKLEKQIEKENKRLEDNVEEQILDVKENISNNKKEIKKVKKDIKKTTKKSNKKIKENKVRLEHFEERTEKKREKDEKKNNEKRKKIKGEILDKLQDNKREIIEIGEELRRRIWETEQYKKSMESKLKNMTKEFKDRLKKWKEEEEKQIQKDRTLIMTILEELKEKRRENENKRFKKEMIKLIRKDNEKEQSKNTVNIKVTEQKENKKEDIKIDNLKTFLNNHTRKQENFEVNGNYKNIKELMKIIEEKDLLINMLMKELEIEKNKHNIYNNNTIIDKENDKDKDKKKSELEQLNSETYMEIEKIKKLKEEILRNQGKGNQQWKDLTKIERTLYEELRKTRRELNELNGNDNIMENERKRLKEIIDKCQNIIKDKAMNNDVNERRKMNRNDKNIQVDLINKKIEKKEDYKKKEKSEKVDKNEMIDNKKTQNTEKQTKPLKDNVNKKEKDEKRKDGINIELKKNDLEDLEDNNGYIEGIIYNFIKNTNYEETKRASIRIYNNNDISIWLKELKGKEQEIYKGKGTIKKEENNEDYMSEWINLMKDNEIKNKEGKKYDYAIRVDIMKNANDNKIMNGKVLLKKIMKETEMKPIEGFIKITKIKGRRYICKNQKQKKKMKKTKKEGYIMIWDERGYDDIKEGKAELYKENGKEMIRVILRIIDEKRKIKEITKEMEFKKKEKGEILTTEYEELDSNYTIRMTIPKKEPEKNGRFRVNMIIKKNKSRYALKGRVYLNKRDISLKKE